MLEYIDALYEATEEALRTAAFGFVSRAQEPLTACPSKEPLMGSRIEFDGLFKGSISLIMPERLATYLTANMTAQEEDDPATIEKRADAVCEILNMICGQFLPRVRPDAPEFRIGIPRQKLAFELRADFIQPAHSCKLPDGSLCLDVEVEGHPIRLILTIDESRIGGLGFS